MYTYNWIALLHTWNIVNQLYFNWKKKMCRRVWNWEDGIGPPVLWLRTGNEFHVSAEVSGSSRDSPVQNFKMQSASLFVQQRSSKPTSQDESMGLFLTESWWVSVAPGARPDLAAGQTAWLIVNKCSQSSQTEMKGTRKANEPQKILKPPADESDTAFPFKRWSFSAIGNFCWSLGLSTVTFAPSF